MKEIEILNKINEEILLIDGEAIKHCFRKGQMCDECWWKKQSLIKIKEFIEKREK